MAGRRWIFTQHLSEPIQTAQEWWDTIDDGTKEKIKYLVAQTEICPSTGRRHVQGAVVFSGTTRMAGIKKMMPTAHVEVAKHWEAAMKYCRKEDTRAPGTEPMEYGALQQGLRSDLVQLTDKIKTGTPMRDIASEHPDTWVRNYKGLGALQALLFPARAIERKVALFWGVTETGKTRTVYDCLSDVYSVFDTMNCWFDGYTGQKNVLLDECGPGMFNHNFLKRLLDRYPMTVPVKGGSVAWSAETIILTSNVPLDKWYLGLSLSDYEALKRRMRIFEFPQEKELARAWLSGSLVRFEGPPAKRSQPEIYEILSDTEEAQPSPDWRADLYDLCEQEC